MERSHCPICSTDDPVHFQNVAARELMICRDCRHIFWATMPSPEVMASYYASAYTEAHDQASIQASARDYYGRHLLELAEQAGKPVSQLHIVDVGCSIPEFLHVAREAGASTVGVDHSEQAEESGVRFGVPVLTPEKFLSTVPCQSIDILRFSHTLEHLIDPVRALREYTSKLRTGGLLYITQPSFPMLRADPSTIQLEDAAWPEHLHFFSPSSLCRMVESAGFSITKLFTSDDTERRALKYHDHLDSLRADQLERYPGDPFFGEMNNAPYYFGANVTLYAERGA